MPVPAAIVLSVVDAHGNEPTTSTSCAGPLEGLDLALDGVYEGVNETILPA